MVRHRPCFRDGCPVSPGFTLSKVYYLTPLLANNKDKRSGGNGEAVVAEEIGEEGLRRVFGVRRAEAGAAGEGVERRPVEAAEFFERGAGGGFGGRGGARDEAPARGAEGRGRRGGRRHRRHG